MVQYVLSLLWIDHCSSMLHFPDIQISNIQISKESVGIISHGFVYMTAMMELNETSLELNSGKKFSENV